jgi:transposase
LWATPDADYAAAFVQLHEATSSPSDDDLKTQTVRLVLDEGKSVGAVARDLDLTETALRAWVHRARANRTRGRTGLTTAEREELAQLRKENRQLRLEREILKNAAAFFAKEPATRSR